MITVNYRFLSSLIKITLLSLKKENILVLVGKRIKQLREQKCIEQQDFAAMCNFEKSNLSRLESGRTNPTIKTLSTITKSLNVSLSEFFEFE